MQILRRLAIGVAIAGLAAVALARTAPGAAVPVTVTFSPQFEARLRSDYGVKEGEVLRSLIIDSIAAVLTADNSKGASVEVVLESAKPTHPTIEQLSRDPGLDFLRSVSPGGAELSATLRAADGHSLGQVNASYYAPTLHLASRAGEAWADARISIERFASAVAAKLKAAS